MTLFPDSNKILYTFNVMKNIGIDKIHISQEQYNQWVKTIDPRMKDALMLRYMLNIEIIVDDDWIILKYLSKPLAKFFISF